MADYKKKDKDPNWVCTFSLRKNPDKDPNKPETKNRPDLILVDSEKKDSKGNPFKKNFTIHGTWCSGSGYFQPDKSVKITIKKTGSLGGTQPTQSENFADQF